MANPLLYCAATGPTMITSYSLTHWLHVWMMGYWIGSDLVVNALTFYTARSTTLSGSQRKRQWDFLMDVDQHPRNALILSVPLGLTLASLMGLVPFGGTGIAITWALSLLWFGYMWLTHWRRATSGGAVLAKWDWWSRYVLIALCAVIGGYSLATGGPLGTRWLAWKVILFGGVMGCGIIIRHYIRVSYQAWPRIWADRKQDGDDALVLTAMTRGTYVLWLLWLLLVVIGWLGAAKPV
jgi:hypothetical protein